MPSTGAIISGIVMMLIGTLIVSKFKKIGSYGYTHDSMIRTSFRGPAGYKFSTLMAGLALMGWGLHTMNFGIVSILILIPAFLLLFHFKKTARTVMIFCYGSEPYERTIIKGQYILLVLTLVLLTTGVYFSVKDWIDVSA